MAKTVFRPGEAKQIEEKVMLPLFKDYAPPVEEVEEVVEEYTGPSVEDVKREIEECRAQFEKEKQTLLDSAQEQADEIISKAKEAAFAEIKQQTDSAQVIKSDAENEANKIIDNAKAEAVKIIQEAENEKLRLENESRENGFSEGKKAGYEDGEAEVSRLIERMHKMLEAVMQKREEILKDTESQIVELVILMARKVVKVLSENQKNVVMANTLAALKKVKTRGDVTIRVNFEDVKLTSEHAKEFIQHVENVQKITVLEDSSVEKGGCIVETDFGAIDARISSQLTELENKILELSPVKNIKKSDSLE